MRARRPARFFAPMLAGVLAAACSSPDGGSDASGSDVATDDTQAPADGSIADASDAFDGGAQHDSAADSMDAAIDASNDVAGSDGGVVCGRPGGVKCPSRGLMSRAYPPPAGAAYAYVDYSCVQVSWSELEPTMGSYTGVGWATIDAALADARLHGVRLRIMAGDSAPHYVLALGGPARPLAANSYHPSVDCPNGGVAVWNNFDIVGGCVPYFWHVDSTGHNPVLDRYDALMAEVARRYESNAVLREVVDSACMTTYAEPFYRAHSGAAETDSNMNLFNAGLNQSTDLACHSRAIAIHASQFPTTLTSLAINGWDIINSTASDYSTSSWMATHDFVTNVALPMLGTRLELQNNGFDGQSGTCASGATPMTDYNCYLAADHGPKGYQTRTLPRLAATVTPMDPQAGLVLALDVAVAQHQNFIELPSGFEPLDQTMLANYDRMLEATPCCR